MTDSTWPRTPSENPAVAEGIYSAIIKSVECSEYLLTTHDVVRIVFWLQQAQVHIVTAFCFPAGEEGRRSQRRLLELCKAVELIPPLRTPMELLGRQLAVEVKSMPQSNPHSDITYPDVQAFLPQSVLGDDASQYSQDDCQT